MRDVSDMVSPSSKADLFKWRAIRAYFASVWFKQTDQKIGNCAFAGARRADQRCDFISTNRKA
ncbi:MAG: hypothetical protein WDN76_05470 [Alphaproteobacteria bacterium]